MNLEPYYIPHYWGDELGPGEKEYLQCSLDGMSGWVEWRADEDGDGGAWVLEAPDVEPEWVGFAPASDARCYACGQSTAHDVMCRDCKGDQS